MRKRITKRARAIDLAGRLLHIRLLPHGEEFYLAFWRHASSKDERRRLYRTFYDNLDLMCFSNEVLDKAEREVSAVIRLLERYGR